jgi:hypothetical protein
MTFRELLELARLAAELVEALLVLAALVGGFLATVLIVAATRT